MPRTAFHRLQSSHIVQAGSIRDGRVLLILVTFIASSLAGDGPTPTVLNNVSVSPMVSINVRNTAGQIGGEVQSTVVPPGVNQNCPNGRILITNDFSLSGLVEQGANIAAIQDVVTGYDLDSGGKSYKSRFEPPYPQDTTKGPYRYHAGQDHDIVTLKNGSVLLLAAGEFDNPDYIAYPSAVNDGLKWAYTPTNTTPNRISRGPLERNGVYVWRSDDCGANFRWTSEIDPANFTILTGLKSEPALGPPTITTVKKPFGGAVHSIFIPLTKSTDGTCAMPQAYSRVQPFFEKTDAKGVKTIGDANGPYTKASGAVFKGYNQGGTDGPLTYVDMRGGGQFGDVYVTLGCVGNDASGDPSVTDPNVYDSTTGKPNVVLSPSKDLNKSIVFRSSDGGKSWMEVAELPVTVWRGAIAPLDQDKLAFYTGGNATIGTVQPNGGPVTFDPNTATTAKLDNYMGCWRDGWDHFCEEPISSNLCISPNFTHSEFVARGPRVKGVQTLLFTQASKLKSPPSGSSGDPVSEGHGQSLILYDPSKNSFAPLQPIAPRSHNQKDFVVHLTAIDAGDGTVLLYWLDAAAAHKTSNPDGSVILVGRSVTVIGRVLFPDGTSSSDFVIAQVPGSAGSPVSQVEYDWDPCSGSSWYGDYHTASGFLQTAHVGSSYARTVYRFFPMWVEPSKAHANFAEVRICRGLCDIHEVPLPPGAFLPKNLTLLPALAGQAWTKTLPRATIEEIRQMRRLSEQDRKAKEALERAKVKP